MKRWRPGRVCYRPKASCSWQYHWSLPKIQNPRKVASHHSCPQRATLILPFIYEPTSFQKPGEPDLCRAYNISALRTSNPALHRPTTIMSAAAALRRLRAPSVNPSAARLFSTTPRASLAKMQIIGRLAGEPELTNTSTGKELVRFTVAANYGTREEPKTSWFRIASFETGPRRDYLLGLPKGCVIFAFL